MILGSTGMLGEVVEKYFNEKNEFELCCPDRTDYDATDLESVKELFEEEHFDYVINCVGILNNKNDKDLYAKVNIVFPHYLQHLSKVYDFKLIHISTNCVFKDMGPHSVNELPNAIDLYGQSKSLGEIIDDKNLTIRTSIIGQSQNGSGLLNWFLNNKNEYIRGYSKSSWNGITTLELAKQIYKIIDKEIKEEKYKTGIMQIGTKEIISKYDLLNLFNDIYKTNKFISIDITTIPHSSLLIPQIKVKNIESQLKEFKEWYK
jgi:dTDP-4-dehydrorhamnose reductase